MMTLLAALTGLCLVIAVLAPFFRGKGGVPAEASSFQSRERLVALRNSLVERYLHEEKAFKNKDFSERTWQKRQQFLVNRYVDATRRMDFLDGVTKSRDGQSGGKVIATVLVLTLASLIGGSGVATAEVVVAPRHVMIVRPMIDQVWGSYIFALENRGSTPEKYTGTLMLPKETVDFRPEEGVAASEVRLGSDGVIIEKNVDPGTNLVLMAFAVKSLFGTTKLTLKPTMQVDDLSILTPPGSLTVSAPGASFTPNVDFSGHPFDRLAIPTVGANTELVVTVEGIPQGRAALWIAGVIVGIAMAGAAAFLAWKTRPRLDALA